MSESSNTARFFLKTKHSCQSPNVMKTIAIFMTVLLALIASATAFADEQSEITFGQGSVLIFCEPQEDSKLTIDEFNAAFPRWISALQTRANEGVIIRAHYLSELRAGIFIVVGGDNRDDAMTNALAVTDELNAIYKDAVDSGQIGTCDMREVGPVAILPMK